MSLYNSTNGSSQQKKMNLLSIIEKLSTTYTYELYNWAVENIAKKTLVFNNESIIILDKILKKISRRSTHLVIKLSDSPTIIKFLTVLESEFIDGRYITKEDDSSNKNYI